MRGELQGTIAQTLQPDCSADSKSQSAGGQLRSSQESLLIFFFGMSLTNTLLRHRHKTTPLRHTGTSTKGS